MPNPRLASRYAKSLIDLALEKGELEKVFADMQWLQQVIKGLVLLGAVCIDVYNQRR